MKPSVYSHSIVLIGNFNPKIFQPAWFAAEELLGKKEVEGANIEIIHSDLAIFSLEWVRLDIMKERFVAQTKLQPYDEALRDLVVGTFTYLSHTPLKQMGINIEMHFQMESEEQWHNAGHKLAPKEIWKGLLEGPGMKSLVMQESRRRDGRKGFIQVHINPSTEVKPGLQILVNDHVEVRDPGTTMGSNEILEDLKSMWPESRKRSEDIIYSLMKRLSG